MASRICVVGAGIAGLVATKVLSEDGFDVTTFEKEATVGGVWSPSRAYPDLRANNPRESYAFSDYPYPAAVDDFPTARQVQTYLESYVDHFDLGRLIRLNSEVLDIARLPTADPGGRSSVFEVTVRPAGGSGSPQTLSFDYAVVCNGVFSQPNLPAVRDRGRFAGKVLHSSQLGSVGIGPGQRVVVVGAGKSALDCAAMAARRAASSTLVFRQPHWMLPRYFFGLVRVDKLLVNRFSELFVKYHHVSRTEAFLHGPGRWIVRLWWRQNARMVRWMVGMPKSFVPEEPLSAGFANIGVGAEFFELLRQGKLSAKRSGVKRFTEAGLELDDGEKIAADIVVFATGWRQELPFLSAQLRDAVLSNGRFKLYRFILPPQEPRLAFLGYASSVACQFTSEVGAHWLSQHFLGKLELPTIEAMEEEIARVHDWTSEAMPGRDQGYFIGPFLAHYADDLLRDMGLPTRRKSSVLAEYMAPFWPDRYATLGADRRRTGFAADYATS